MEPPSHDLRVHVAATATKLAASAPGERLERLLGEIESGLQTAASTPDLASGMGEEEAEDELAKLHAATPQSLAVGRWSLTITRRLQPIAVALHAVKLSMSVVFPWGVSIGASF